MKYEEALKKVSEYGQEHVLQYYEELSEEGKAALLAQIEQTDFSVLAKAAQAGKEQVRGMITPIPAMKLSEIEEKKAEYTEKGIEMIRAGKVGAVLLAGGMGTRLGSDNPKGMYNIGLTKEVYIFERLIRNMLDVVEKAGNYQGALIRKDEYVRSFKKVNLVEDEYDASKLVYLVDYLLDQWCTYQQQIGPATNC